jgi:hypothetical protein
MRALLILAAVPLLAAPAARADIFAVADGGNGTDIAAVNASTGATFALPATVNTAADESHPSISADGTKLVFQRDDGATRIIVATLPSGETRDLFNVFEQSANPQTSPTISPDGTTVATGERFQQGVSVFAALTLTDLASGTRTTYRPFYDYGSGPQGGITADAVFGDGVIAFGARQDSRTRGIILGQRPGTGARFPMLTDGFDFEHPTLGGGQLVFDARPLSVNGTPHEGDLFFVPATPATGSPPRPVELPVIVNTAADEHHPAFTPDGRYLGFLRTVNGRDRVFLLDTQTQTIVNPAGADVVHHTIFGGNLSLFVRPVLKSGTLTPNGFISFIALNPTGVGILVQRVVGKTKLLGRTVPKLELVGRVPLGRFKKGHGRVRWDGRVNGRKLKPGTYQVTVRAVSPKGAITDLAKPRRLRVR